MKIKKDLPQFNQEIALLILSAKQAAELYLATDGEIERIDMIKIPRPRFSDKEEFFMTRKGGRMIKAGAGSYEHQPLKNELEKEMLHHLANQIKETLKTKKITSIYIFSSPYTINAVKDILSKEAKKLLRFTKSGNYIDHHPFEILEIIKKEKPGAPVLESEEARKILNKF